MEKKGELEKEAFVLFIVETQVFNAYVISQHSHQNRKDNNFVKTSPKIIF